MSEFTPEGLADLHRRCDGLQAASERAYAAVAALKRQAETTPDSTVSCTAWDAALLVEKALGVDALAWTGPDGTVYDLGRDLIDRVRTHWRLAGTYTGVGVPMLVEVRADGGVCGCRYQITSVIVSHGPLAQVRGKDEPDA